MLLGPQVLISGSTPSAEELLASEGFDPVYGARPLKRAIQSLIQNPLAMKLLAGEIKPGEVLEVSGRSREGSDELCVEGACPFAGDCSECISMEFKFSLLARLLPNS